MTEEELMKLSSSVELNRNPRPYVVITDTCDVAGEFESIERARDYAVLLIQCRAFKRCDIAKKMEGLELDG